MYAVEVFVVTVDLFYTEIGFTKGHNRL